MGFDSSFPVFSFTWERTGLPFFALSSSWFLLRFEKMKIDSAHVSEDGRPFVWRLALGAGLRVEPRPASLPLYPFDGRQSQIDEHQLVVADRGSSKTRQRDSSHGT
ncbi:hypothetical protein KM043_000807 [Ampulex compressa]|nr:hypothetical protein KM043_000807 [Ampulex compressa]